MKMNIKRFAEITGVSVRTLHYYDEIELLKPDFVDEKNGYRYYGEKSLSRMQEIMFYRELDFSLDNIKKIVSSPNYNKNEALEGQKQLLILKKERLEKIINAIECEQKGEKKMGFNIFDKSEFESVRETYKEEAEKRWGSTDAYKENKEKTADYSSDKWDEVGRGLNEIISEFSNVMKNGISETDEISLALAEKLKNYITETQYTCTNEILLCLGEMYVSDERFKNNIDKNGEGTAEFINRAIKAYCGKCSHNMQ